MVLFRLQNRGLNVTLLEPPAIFYEVLEVFELESVFDVEKLFGGLSAACDFVDLAQKAFYTRPVAPLQGSFGRLFEASPTVSRLPIHPPNSF